MNPILLNLRILLLLHGLGIWHQLFPGQVLLANYHQKRPSPPVGHSQLFNKLKLDSSQPWIVVSLIIIHPTSFVSVTGSHPLRSWLVRVSLLFLLWAFLPFRFPLALCCPLLGCPWDAVTILSRLLALLGTGRCSLLWGARLLRGTLLVLIWMPSHIQELLQSKLQLQSAQK